MDSSIIGKKVILVIAHIDYQPIEYSVTKKMLEEAGVYVITASDTMGGAVASDKSTTPVDIELKEITNITNYDGIFFIGGPGALQYLDNSISYHLISQAKKHHIPYGAICISPRILAKAGGLQGKRATGWNDDGALETILNGFGAEYNTREHVIIDDLVVTADGPDASDEFARGIIYVLTIKALQK